MPARILPDYYITDPKVEEAISGMFDVSERYFYMDQPKYVVSPKNLGDPKSIIKKAFEELVKVLRPLGFMPVLGKERDKYILTLGRIPSSGESNNRRNLLLFVATCGTIFLDGYLRSNNPILYDILMPNTPVFLNSLYFTFAILAIFGIHELGHKAITMIRGVEASMPYFIPAPPGMGGTFGAVITQKQPPTNRDALFDLGLSGPLVGFIVTVIIAIVGLNLSFVVPIGEVDVWTTAYPEIQFQPIPFPLLLNLISDIFNPTSGEMVLLLHPVAFAAWVGCLVTYINLIPAWQLDGGHISRALIGRSYHKIVSLAGIVMLVISGYFIMALMIGYFMIKTPQNAFEGPLDDISPLSTSRKLLVLVYVAMLALTLVYFSPF
jgi:Zn-dependent protease